MLQRCDAEGMPLVLPPPVERFDPITARWLTPGGPLHDPARDEVDPEGMEPVRLIAPIPPELADWDDQTRGAGRESIGISASRRFRSATLAVLGVGLTALVVAGMVIGAG
jgi:hypothetical protein